RVLPRANRDVEIVVRRDGERHTLSVVPEAQTKYEIGDIGIAPDVHPQLTQVMAGSPAAAAGLQAGDVIIRVNGHDTTDVPLIDGAGGRPARAVTLTGRRGGGEQEIVVTPRDEGGVGRIGVQFSPLETRTVDPTFMRAIGLSVEQNVQWSTMIFEMLGGLLTADTSPRQLMGPIGIAEVAGGAAAVSWVALFATMAMISLNLGLLNLLPIPILDGGHIAILAIEGLARRDFSMRAKERMLMAGFAMLMLLMVTVIYNDLTRVEWLRRLLG